MTPAQGFTGAINELRVAADMLQRGFDVFRNMNGSSEPDLVVRRGTRAWAIEVKSGGTRNGGRWLSTSQNGYSRSRSTADVLAVVFPDGRIRYTDARVRGRPGGRGVREWDWSALGEAA